MRLSASMSVMEWGKTCEIFFSQTNSWLKYLWWAVPLITPAFRSGSSFWTSCRRATSRFRHSGNCLKSNRWLWCLQYVSEIRQIVLFGLNFLVVLLSKIHEIILPIFFRVASLTLGQSYDCRSASEVILKNMGKIISHVSRRSLNKVYTMESTLP